MFCKLCMKEKNLSNSHIIPKFVVRWLKDTSATGYLRQAEKPNIRKQDIITRKILCRHCEGLFSRNETQFAKNIFLPFQNDKVKRFQYDDWLRAFAVSVFWRLGVADLEDFRVFKPHLVGYLEEALAIWRGSLLSGEFSDDRYAHHILFFFQQSSFQFYP